MPNPNFAVAPNKAGWWVTGLTWGYAGLVLLVLALARWSGDRWWVGTVLLYMPKVVWLLVIPVLALAAAWARRPRLWGMQCATLLVIVGPLMAASVPVWQLWVPEPEGERIRIATFNRGTETINIPALIAWLEQEEIDVLCLQAVPIGPLPELETDFDEHGWHRTEVPTIVSKLAIVEERTTKVRPRPRRDSWGLRTTRARLQTESGAEFDVLSAHMPTLRPGFDALFAGQPEELQALVTWRRLQVGYLLGDVLEATDVPIVLAGDLNTPSESPMLDPLRVYLRFAFSQAGWGHGYTAPTKFPWLRIDHVLISTQWTVTRCWVGPDLGSDHLPLVAELVLHSPPPSTP